MSRVFTNDAANYLEATGNLASTSQEVTFGAWVQDDPTGAGQRAAIALGRSSANRRWAGGDGTAGRAWTFDGSVSSQSATGILNISGGWSLLIYRRKDKSGTLTWEAFGDGVALPATVTTTSNAGLAAGDDNVRVGATTSATAPFKGKVAHAFVFTRGLSDAEIADLAAGTNPSSLDATGRYVYYPLTDASLDNAWNADSGVGALTVTGTVANDDADNPTVSAPVVPASVTIAPADLPLTPGATFNFTYSDYETVPTTLTVSDGTNTITIASPTINDNGDGTGSGSGAMPALPTTGTESLVLFGDVDVELT